MGPDQPLLPAMEEHRSQAERASRLFLAQLEKLQQLTEIDHRRRATTSKRPQRATSFTDAAALFLAQDCNCPNGIEAKLRLLGRDRKSRRDGPVQRLEYYQFRLWFFFLVS